MRKKSSRLIRLLKLLRHIPIPMLYRKIRQMKRGRPIIYGSRSMMAVLIVMMARRIRSIKGVHKFLRENPHIRRYCGLRRLPDRVTLSRRLRNLLAEMFADSRYMRLRTKS